jgi:hypothetical protein
MMTVNRTSAERLLVVQLAPNTRRILNGAGAVIMAGVIVSIPWTWQIVSGMEELWALEIPGTLLAAAFGAVLMFLLFVVLHEMRDNSRRFDTTQSTLVVHRCRGISHTYSWSNLQRVTGSRWFVVLQFENSGPVELVYSMGVRPSLAELREIFSFAGIPVRYFSIGPLLLWFWYVKRD